MHMSRELRTGLSQPAGQIAERGDIVKCADDVLEARHRVGERLILAGGIHNRKLDERRRIGLWALMSGDSVDRAE